MSSWHLDESGGERIDGRRSGSSYHRYYFSLIESWRSVRYRDLVSNKETLARLCATLGLHYFAGKERYWETPQHTVFGNNSTRIHLYDQSSSSFDKVKQSIIDSRVEPEELSAHRTISYAAVPDFVPGQDEKIFKQIADVLEARDVFKESREPSPQPSAVSALRIGSLLQAYQVAKLKWGLAWAIDALRR